MSFNTNYLIKKLQIIIITIMIIVLFKIVHVELLRTVDIARMKCNLLCKDPQPRATRVANLINSTTKVAQYMTIIHRCDEGAGCCTEKTKICSVAKFEEIEILVHMEVKKNQYSLEKFVVKNHTECSCQPVIDDYNYK